MNAHAIEEMGASAAHPDLDIIFVESGGDNLAATFSPELRSTATSTSSTSPRATRYRAKAARGLPNRHC